MEKKSLFADLPTSLKNELFEVIAESENVRIERILSKGQKTPTGKWYDQELNEFVIMLKGGANLMFEGDSESCDLSPGDYINIPAHTKHRVEWIDEDTVSVWLAVHYK